ncbi:MAG TPA: hypothetical protein VFD41_11650 [Actinomycetales bacterium]|nr:hypothetical protein [Actinomycetales bacterium]
MTSATLEATAQGHRVPRLLLWVDGEEVSGHVVASLSVEERVDRPSTLSLVVASSPVAGPPSGDGSAEGGDWDALLRGEQARALGMPGLRLLSRVTVGFSLTPPSPADGPVESQVVFDGYVAGLEHRYAEARVPDSELLVSGVDASCLMHQETVTRRWQDLSDAEIATQLFGKYGFDHAVDPTPRRSATVSALLQRATDAEFLRLLARRNGFEVFVAPSGTPVAAGRNPGTGVVGHFRSAPVGRDKLPAAWLFPPEAPALVDMTARYDAYQPASVRSWHIDGRRRIVRSVEVDDPGYARTGTMTRGAVVGGRLAEILGSSGTTVVPADIRTSDVPYDAEELATLAQADLRAADWFATAEATVAATRYPAVVRAGRTLPVTGTGPIFAGDWYVRAVTHRWGAARALPGDPPVAELGVAAEEVDFTYEVDVELARNALGGEP